MDSGVHFFGWVGSKSIALSFDKAAFLSSDTSDLMRMVEEGGRKVKWRECFLVLALEKWENVFDFNIKWHTHRRCRRTS